MSIRVTDVQALLRHFQSLGHDVITDPHALHFEGQKYSRALEHSLTIGSAPHNKYNLLTSHLIQSEGPRISRLTTSSRSNGDFDELNRSADAKIPTRFLVSKKDYDSRDAALIGEYPEVDTQGNRVYDTYSNFALPRRFRHEEESNAPRGSVLWTPAEGNAHSSIHELFEAHRSPGYDLPSSNQINEFHDIPDGVERIPLGEKFNHSRALSELAHPLKPFSGLIHVAQKTGNYTNDKHYVYNPETEQLMEPRD